MEQDNRVRQKNSCPVWKKADQGFFQGRHMQVDSKDVYCFPKKASQTRYQVEGVKSIMDL